MGAHKLSSYRNVVTLNFGAINDQDIITLASGEIANIIL